MWSVAVEKTYSSPSSKHDNSIHAHQLLSLWHERQKDHLWAIGFLMEIKGSSYRKPGAIMLFNDLGQHFGLLSGGCIEQHLCRAAVRAIADQKSVIVSYNLDENEDEDNWQAAIGCGGSVTVLIAPLSAENNYLELESCYSTLLQNKFCELSLDAKNGESAGSLRAVQTVKKHNLSEISGFANYDKSQEILSVKFLPAPSILICGAGVDAIPLANIATELGWKVILNETRSQYQKSGRFPLSTQTESLDYNKLDTLPQWESVHCIIIMHHHLALDAKALTAALTSNAQYIGVLGPTNRMQKLLAITQLKAEDFGERLHGPCGLALGGDSPSSVALSIISHCHAVLTHAKMKTLPL